MTEWLDEDELEYDEQTFEFGAHALVVTTVGELPLEVLSALEEKHEEISGQRAWPGSLLLACHLYAHPRVVRGACVLELGAGCGLVGMLAARLGARATLITDGDAATVRLLRRNLARNAPLPRAAASVLRWGDTRALTRVVGSGSGGGADNDDGVDATADQRRADAGGDDSNPDDSAMKTFAAALASGRDGDAAFGPSPVILAGDVLYKHELIAPFFETLRMLLLQLGGDVSSAAGGAVPAAAAYLCHLPRAGVEHTHVRSALRTHGLRVRSALSGTAVAAAAMASGDTGAFVGGDDCSKEDTAAAMLYHLTLRADGDDSDDNCDGVGNSDAAEAVAAAVAAAIAGDDLDETDGSVRVASTDNGNAAQEGATSARASVGGAAADVADDDEVSVYDDDDGLSSGAAAALHSCDVMNLTRDGSLALVHKHFASCGKLAMVIKTADGEARVQFETAEAVVRALGLDGSALAGGRIRVARTAAPAAE